MNYKRIYDQLISHAQATNTSQTEYYEKHHILPRSMGGGDEESNLVKLTPRQHFIAHRLLTKFTTGKDRGKMLQAVRLMSISESATRFRPNSRAYESIRSEWLKVCPIIINLRNSSDERYFNLGKHPLFTKSVSDSKRLNRVHKSFKTKKGCRFINTLRSIYTLGFEGIANCKTNEVGFSSLVDLAEQDGYLIKDDECNVSSYRFTDKFKQLKFMGVANTSTFFEYLYSKNQFARGSQDLKKCFTDYNKQCANDYVVNEWDGTKTILKPFNNWLTLDHPLADKFYTPLTVEEAKQVLEQLKAA